MQPVVALALLHPRPAAPSAQHLPLHVKHSGALPARTWQLRVPQPVVITKARRGPVEDMASQFGAALGKVMTGHAAQQVWATQEGEEAFEGSDGQGADGTYGQQENSYGEASTDGDTDLTGTVTRWNFEKGFGFITPSEGGEDIFCHITTVASGVPQWGDEVTYDRYYDDQRGRMLCKNVRLQGASSSSEEDGQEIGGREIGTVTRWQGDKGYGFIQPSRGGAYIFCHISAFTDGGDGVAIGDQVSFERDYDDRQGKWRCSGVQREGGGGSEGADIPAGDTGARKTGTITRWNVDRGFGFVRPSEGGTDLFVHATGLVEGDGSVQDGDPVSFLKEFDSYRGMWRATAVRRAEGDEIPADSSVAMGAAQDGGQESSAEQQASPDSGMVQEEQKSDQRAVPSIAYRLAGSFSDWSVRPEALGSGTDAGDVIVIRQDAEKVGSKHREAFQILPDGNWDRRIYPAGGAQATTVPLQPGGPPQKAAGDDGKDGGHGRNFAVDGSPGNAFKITFDSQQKLVSCELKS
eukprot:gnl/TRDRNA2_/TRDRNA2_160287_c0_seq1.p1 gnl/TRDRNA2_/TRDRNA2_160287_c0~~gnl/TRDRNA2_/TRDRNA2_160287_c0_seq1.p1  ORF type:complete len:560 (-),score=92.97 gnl/TRDRNA2_/TRDRNA2_160287_c0_seq1:31-1593(-)